MPHSAASDLGLHCLPVPKMGGLKVTRNVFDGVIIYTEELYRKGERSIQIEDVLEKF